MSRNQRERAERRQGARRMGAALPPGARKLPRQTIVLMSGERLVYDQSILEGGYLLSDMNYRIIDKTAYYLEGPFGGVVAALDAEVAGSVHRSVNIIRKSPYVPAGLVLQIAHVFYPDLHMIAFGVEQPSFYAGAGMYCFGIGEWEVGMHEGD